MKLQDLIFLVGFIVLILMRKPKLSVMVGLLCLVISIPLYTKWVFFTAERLTWYGGAFFLLATLQLLFSIIYENRD